MSVILTHTETNNKLIILKLLKDIFVVIIIFIC